MHHSPGLPGLPDWRLSHPLKRIDDQHSRFLAVPQKIQRNETTLSSHHPRHMQEAVKLSSFSILDKWQSVRHPSLNLHLCTYANGSVAQGDSHIYFLTQHSRNNLNFNYLIVITPHQSSFIFHLFPSHFSRCKTP